MTSPPDMRAAGGGTRYRATVPPDELELVPPEARDDPQQLVHWFVQDEASDPFVAGAYWALGWSLSTVFGRLIGGVLEGLTLSNVERWDGEAWVPVA